MVTACAGLTLAVVLQLSNPITGALASAGECLLQKKNELHSQKGYVGADDEEAFFDHAELPVEGQFWGELLDDATIPGGQASASSTPLRRRWRGWRTGACNLLRAALVDSDCLMDLPAWLVEPDFVQMQGSIPDDRELFFRPVSVTLYCLMCLIILCIVIHTGATFAKNADELSANLAPSFITEVLDTAARSNPLAPVVGLLLLANRVYMLQSTEGKGEVEVWLKVCMIVASVGMLFQYVTVGVVSVTCDKTKPTRFSVLSGHAQDCHPTVSKFTFAGCCGRSSSFGLQYASLVSIYVGSLGLIVGMFVTGRGVDNVTSASHSTALLVLLFLVVQFCLWATSDPTSEEKLRFRAAAARADTVVNKAAIFAVLFMSTRLRQIQKGKPSGEPPKILSAAFIAGVFSIYLEAILAACCGTDDKDRAESSSEDDGEKAAPSRSQRVIHTLEGLLAGIGYAAAAVVGHYIVHPWVDEPLPMSPTIQGVVTLCTIFLSVHFLLSIYDVLQRILNFTSTKAQDALIAARNSVGMCPLLCVLFLACRMRALQISNNKGMPQWWEQDFLYLCLGATLIEVLCCITVPAFYKEVCVDADGNPSYDIQSPTGAYVVTVVRYIALLGLHTAIIGICVAVFLMTPESCMAGRPDNKEFWRSGARATMWTLVVVMMASLLSSAKVAGLVTKLAIESIDELLLGAEITLDTAVLSLCYGSVIIKGLIIKNPSSHSYTTDHLAKVDLVAVKLNIGRAIRTLGKHIILKEIVINGAELNYEMGSHGGPSNINAILQHLETKEAPEEAKQPPKEGPKETPKETPPASPPPEAEKSAEGEQGVVLNRLLIKNVHARVVHPTMGPIAAVDLGTMNIDDFSKSGGVSDIVIFVLKTVLKSVLSNADIMGHVLVQTAAKAVKSAAGGVAECCRGVPMLAAKGCLPGRPARKEQ